MRLPHGMLHGNHPITVYGLHLDIMAIICRLSFEFRQADATAGVRSFTHGVDDITTNRADVKAAVAYIGALIAIHHTLSG